MPKMPPKLVSLAVALAALTGEAALVAEPADAKIADPGDLEQAGVTSSAAQKPNRIVTTGQDYLGFTISHRPNGTVLAEHYSHVSHASHASHASHYSGR